MKLKYLIYISIILVLFVSCADSGLTVIADNETAAFCESTAAGEPSAGEVSIVFPVISEALEQTVGISDTYNPPGSRVFMTAEEVSVRLYDEDGLVDEISQSQLVSGSSSFIFSDIPFGENYYIQADIFNHDVSVSAPVLSGHSALFSVNAIGQTVSVYMIPNSPVEFDSVSPATHTMNGSLCDIGGVSSLGGEIWYEYFMNDYGLEITVSPDEASSVYILAATDAGAVIVSQVAEQYDVSGTHGGDTELTIPAGPFGNKIYIGILLLADDQLEHSFTMTANDILPGYLEVSLNDQSGGFTGYDIYHVLKQYPYSEQGVADASATVLSGSTACIMADSAGSGIWLGSGTWYLDSSIDINGNGQIDGGDFIINATEVIMTGNTVVSLTDADYWEVPTLDDYEDDDSYETASSITADAPPQLRTFDTDLDIDWCSLEVISGEQYEIATSQSGDNLLDTFLTLYDSTGLNPLAEHDDIEYPANPFSIITWTAGFTGTAYIRVSGYPGSVGEYYLSVITN